MIIVSNKMFNIIVARAKVVAEEQFRRVMFDTRPEVAELIRERVVTGDGRALCRAAGSMRRGE